MALIRGKKITFDKVVGTYSKDEFAKLCNSLPVFKELPIKERNLKIKEAYGNLKGNVKQVSKPELGSDLHSNNVKSDGGDIRAESGADDGGENIEGKEDKTEVLDKKLRKPKKETKL